MQPYLESLPDHIDGAPPWTPTNRGHGLTSRPLKHDPEIPPRDLKDLRTDHRPDMFIQSRETYHAYIYTLYQSLQPNPFHVPYHPIPIHHTLFINIEFQLISLPCHFNTNHLIKITC